MVWRLALVEACLPRASLFDLPLDPSFLCVNQSESRSAESIHQVTLLREKWLEARLVFILIGNLLGFG